MTCTDLVFKLPLMAAGIIGVILGQAWGCVLWAAVAAIAVYISIVLWFSEREYVNPAWERWLTLPLFGAFSCIGGWLLLPVLCYGAQRCNQVKVFKEGR